MNKAGIRYTRLITALLLASSTLILSACTPSKQYAGSKKDGAFFTVPNQWREISNSALNKEEGKSKSQSDLDQIGRAHV